ncbi:hypothetical protein MtrunA17_Chr2g0295071 [Medicago truncatula]|uniref:Uncharacterized protein n=1 Tax=Medicago truncatula TaxID=3880 RepID=G7IMZ1_MEDTR|nr:hypothetical protein MTR_2g035160 [Medicago truncatula]RHN73118.1 hypothetical protein MtrunA17_Chr2g0295071 [Medicago truncatula]
MLKRKTRLHIYIKEATRTRPVIHVSALESRFGTKPRQEKEREREGIEGNRKLTKQ